jgi:hypothetical protein
MRSVVGSAATLFWCALCTCTHHSDDSRRPGTRSTYAYAEWSGPIVARICSQDSTPLSIPLVSKSGSAATMTCALEKRIRVFKLPLGIFEIGEQLLLPPNSSITGASSPNDMTDPTRSPDWGSQTLFLATRGATRFNMSYCSAADMVHTRVGFVLSSFCTVRDISYQGVDTIRPDENGWLCGGGVFETTGCAATNCGNSSIVNNGGSDGLGSEHVTIDNVRINDYYYAQDQSQIGAAIEGNSDCSGGDREGDDPGGAECCFCQPNRVRSSQVAVWVPDTRDTEGTRHLLVSRLVSRSTQADGINLHGRVRHAIVEDSYVENTGDDVFVLWGGLRNPENVTFRRCVAVAPGVTRPNWYGNCVATGGLLSAVFQNITCRAPTLLHPILHPTTAPGVLRMDTSCAWFHTSFGSSYPPGNSLVIQNWRFEDLQGEPYTPETGVMDQPVVGKMAWTRPNSSSTMVGSNASAEGSGRGGGGDPLATVAPFYFPEGNAAGINVHVVS